jgi:hypothetical protein
MLAKKATTKPRDTSFKDLFCDFKRSISKCVYEKWRIEWELNDQSNKLRSIKSNTSPWKCIHALSRKDSIVLTRLRIGHTWLTHSHLFNNSNPPTCNCGEIISVFHFFTCKRYEQKRKLFNINFATLSEDKLDSYNKIIQFAKSINIYDNI